jgi:hypothetical protein
MRTVIKFRSRRDSASVPGDQSKGAELQESRETQSADPFIESNMRFFRKEEVAMREEDTDATLEYMKRKNLPMNRETWMAWSYPDGIPKPWTAELEAEVPECFREGSDTST